MSELKTLKDIEEKAIKDLCKNLGVEKDTLCNFGQMGLMTVEELVSAFFNSEKVEAVKWIKRDIKRLGEHKSFLKNYTFMSFLNITEEDLKDGK